MCKIKSCPDCGETKNLIFLGPGDYERDKVGNCSRLMVYQCPKCKTLIKG